MMSGADRAQIYRIFDEALDVELGLRADFVRERCGADADLAREVAELLEIAARELKDTAALLPSGRRSRG